ncbi:hypothetical protein [Bathymodiolus platifrons methanotrophic gill symbiont]|uniref:hypothetical protein n=1 Tax=Bathymodiolus platifrons methanotrophic gill symbiont TaxID=113268 RepID=UPI001E40DD22|nr:hypothetical protein [Bathymodiolus platifrons methanotrophic gill symbiont]
MKKYYIGLSVTYHAPALAIVDDQGEVLFAEATERYLQNKRALNCPADPLLRVQELLQQYCPSPGAFVIASNWRKKRPLSSVFPLKATIAKKLREYALF